MKRGVAMVFAVAAVCLGMRGLGPTDAGAASEPVVRTTQGAIAMRGLEGDIDDATQRATLEPDDASACMRLSALLYQRSRISGDIDAMGRALSLADVCVERHPESAAAHLLRAGQRQSLHLFADARADLVRARELGGDEATIAGLERELDWNAGHWGPVARAIREDARRAPTVASIARLARLEHDLRRYDAAEAAYRRALALVDDVAPVPVAMLELQRGMNLYDAGRLQDAERVFRSAHRRMPQYTAAREHLAETLHHLGRDAEAIALYEDLVRTTTDPEFMGALASLLRAHGRVPEADALRRRATQRYEALLASYPDAMAWHAAEYFAGEGADLPRAIRLLERNAELRPTPESFDALARALGASGDAARSASLQRRAESERQGVRESR